MRHSHIEDFGQYVLLGKSNSVVLGFDTSDTIMDFDVAGFKVTPKNLNKEIDFVPRDGGSNTLPLDIIRKSGSNVTVSSNLDFKTAIAYGEGVQVLRRHRADDGKIHVDEVLRSEAPEVFDFLEHNDVNRFILELINDLRIFGDAFVEYIFDRNTDGHRLVQMRSRETCYSLISRMDKKGHIGYHGYCDDWARKSYTETLATPLLDRNFPLYDLKRHMGMVPDDNGEQKPTGERRLVQMLSLPTSGRFYYAHPYWWSIFDSGWYDFSNSIITFKKALIHNEMVPRHIVYIRDSYYEKLYKDHGADTPDKKKAVRTKFLKDIDSFLAGEENAGTGILSPFEYNQMKGGEMKDIIIDNVDDKQKGGDYIEDSEESSNVLCYGMGVHSSILGNSPGKSKTINGTEARELFTIQQALSKYLQQLVVQPLYFAKSMNGWDADLEFAIANLQLTVLDANSGAVKQKGIRPDTNQDTHDS
ncbi:MAG: hypothetical protein K6B45_04745 [Bacteroidaceae bacterium]|nr:hypothetical protein [Bacteroidaceae bacterium]